MSEHLWFLLHWESLPAAQLHQILWCEYAKREKVSTETSTNSFWSPKPLNAGKSSQLAAGIRAGAGNAPGFLLRVDMKSSAVDLSAAQWGGQSLVPPTIEVIYWTGVWSQRRREAFSEPGSRWWSRWASPWRPERRRGARTELPRTDIQVLYILFFNHISLRTWCCFQTCCLSSAVNSTKRRTNWFWFLVLV